jgi:hypothetical protein
MYFCKRLIGMLDKENKADLVRELTAKTSEVTKIPADTRPKNRGGKSMPVDYTE